MSQAGWSWLPCCLALALSPGDPFLDLSYAAALARSKEQHRVLLVDATASWCPPCRRMESEVWPSDAVRAWVAEHAVAIQIDVDEQHDLAGSLGIEAMPTLIAFKDGAEFDRIVGFRDVDTLVGWLDGVLAGRRAGDEVRERARSLAGSDDLDARYAVARDLLRQRDYEAAAQQYVWLWKNTRGSPRYAGVRVSFMLSDIRELCDADEPAREAFTAFLDVLDRKLRAGGWTFHADWTDWFSLSRELENDTRVLAFYSDRHDADGRLMWSGPRGGLADIVEREFFDVLVRHERFAEAGRLLPDLAAAAQSKLALFRTVAATERWLGHGDGELSAYERRELQRELSCFHAAALAIGRDATALAIARLLIDEHDDADSRIALAKTALAAGCAGTQHAAWLDEAERLGADVGELRAALAAAAPAPAGEAPPADGR